MPSRLLRAFYLLFLAVMLVAYAASRASGAPPDDMHQDVQILGEQWC